MLRTNFKINFIINFVRWRVKIYLTLDSTKMNFGVDCMHLHHHKFKKIKEINAFRSISRSSQASKTRKWGWEISLATYEIKKDSDGEREQFFQFGRGKKTLLKPFSLLFPLMKTFARNHEIFCCNCWKRRCFRGTFFTTFVYISC